MAIRTDFTAGEVLAAADLNDTFDDARSNASNLTAGTMPEARLAAGVAVPIGTILETLRDTAPTNFALCQGQTLTAAESVYPALWAALPAAFKSGSDIILPDMRGRVNIGAGTGAGLTARTLGGTGGTETHTLTQAEMPVHTHTQNAHGHTQSGHVHSVTIASNGSHAHNVPRNLVAQFGTGTLGLQSSGGSAIPLNLTGDPQGTTTAGAHDHTTTVSESFPGIFNETATNQNAGSGNAHANMQPFVVVNKMIRIA
jgi:microcystin-dependent protein